MSEVGLMGTVLNQGTPTPPREGAAATQAQPTGASQKCMQMMPALLYHEKQEILIVMWSLPIFLNVGK